MEINEDNVIKHYSNGKNIFAILIEEDVPMSIFNLIIKLNQQGELISEKVYRHKMNPEFGMEYYNGNTDFGSFEGRIQNFEPNRLFTLNRQDIECLDEVDCCDLPSGGVGIGSNNGPSDNTGASGGSTSADCIWISGCSPCSCLGVCHPGCNCRGTRVRYFSFLQCDWPLTETEPEITRDGDEDCCPGTSDEIPTHPGIDPSTVGSEEVNQDFTESIQMGLGTSNFINDFLGSNSEPSVSQQVMDAAICGECNAYAASEYQEQQENGFNYEVHSFEQCVLTSLVNNSPCLSSFESILSEAPYHGNYEFTLEEQLALIGPIGSADCGNMEEFRATIEDAVVTNVINECYDGQFADFALSLNLTFSQVDALCGNDNDSSIIPTCSNCTEDQMEQIIDVFNESMYWIDCAVDKLAGYEESQSEEVTDCLDGSFGGDTSSETIEFLQFMLGLLKEGLQSGQQFEMGGESPGDHCATSSSSGYVLINFNGSPVDGIIYLCPTRWENNLNSPIGTQYYGQELIIHEGTHLYLGTMDIEYSWSSEYYHLNSLQHTMNADSYSFLISCLCV